MEDYKKIIANNKLIHEFMGRKPEIEYCIGSKDGSSFRYSPSNIGFDWPPSQKAECERWLKENEPKGYAEDQAMLTLENYPYYDQDWNKLMEVIDKIRDKGMSIDIITFHFSEKHNQTNGTRICGKDRNPFVFNENENDLKNTVYLSVLGFIDWYNLNKI